MPTHSPVPGQEGGTISLSQNLSSRCRFLCSEIEAMFRNVGPADIDVVAALGDHLVTGTGALANTTVDTFKDFPQISFAIGEDVIRFKDILIIMRDVCHKVEEEPGEGSEQFQTF